MIFMAPNNENSGFPSTIEALEGLLRWYAEMGVDCPLDSVPHDRFAEAAARGPAEPTRAKVRIGAANSLPDEPISRTPAGTERSSQSLPHRTPAFPRTERALPEKAATLPADAVTQSARESAAAAKNLDELREKLLAFEGCGLKATATQLVFGDGNPASDIMFVGEAPGADEDRTGRPFVGRAGQLLDRMLASIDLDRGKVYIANVVPWRPPGNRIPTPLETAVCLPFTQRQVELVAPRILVCLGNAPTQTLLGAKDGILKIRGRWYHYEAGGKKIRAMPMLHPAYLLRQPAQKKLAWQDLREVAKALATDREAAQ
jgi:DNA polymerase